MIPACKPKLPPADKLLPYLKRIDENRYYTNFGPLVCELEERLAGWIGAPQTSLISCSNGTVAIELAIAAHHIRPGSYVMLPAWTFVATAHAVLAQGLLPFFVDVDPESWALTPEIAEKAMAECPGPLALVLPVAPFGLPLPVREWEVFSKRHKVDVIIDGAAMWPPDIKVSDTVTTTLSLHTTKLLSAGEGGLILKNDKDFIADIKSISNFDLFNPEGVSSGAMNGKMSEYHAAVAHASLDEWKDIEADFMRVARRYRENLKSSELVKVRPGYGEKHFSAVTVLQTRDEMEDARLHERGIGARPCWRRGCHREPLFKDVARTEVPVAEYLAFRNTAVPCFRDLPDSDIDFICEEILDYLGGL